MESLVDVNDTVNVLDGLGQEDGDCADGESSQRCRPTDPPTPIESVADDRFSLLIIETIPHRGV